jgi:hypothetical protein
MHVLNLYARGEFGKERTQWTKCVVTYLSEYFEQCEAEESGGSGVSGVGFYYNWILFWTELLDKSKWVGRFSLVCQRRYFRSFLVKNGIF